MRRTNLINTIKKNIYNYINEGVNSIKSLNNNNSHYKINNNNKFNKLLNNLKKNL